jgi:hypothetical protein
MVNRRIVFASARAWQSRTAADPVFHFRRSASARPFQMRGWNAIRHHTPSFRVAHFQGRDRGEEGIVPPPGVERERARAVPLQIESAGLCKSGWV